MKIQWDKKQLCDTRGYPMTQALFLEILYNKDYAIFTFNDDDKEYEGKTYYSLRKYYLEIADPTEYQFAKTCLLGWDHWKRILENKIIRKEVDKWREELEVSLRSEGILSIIETSASGENFQASKWLVDKGWDKRPAGRPSKLEIEREKRVAERINSDFDATVIRMSKYTENG